MWGGWWSRSRRILALAVVVGVTWVVAGCASQPSPESGGAPGFLWGLVHGFLILVDFIIGLFTDARIYEYPNSGGWYDFGFLIGASMFLAGGGAGSRRS